MYRDQFGEFACGYWGLRVNSKIKTTDMALKQRHKTDEIVTNDMKIG